MQVAMFMGAGKPLSIERVADPEAHKDQVVVKVGRCGICSSDLHMTEAHGGMPPGGVLGHEFSGEVVALGKGVSGIAVGDKVSVLPAFSCGRCSACQAGAPFACKEGSRTLGVGPTWGGYAEYAVVSARWCVAMPSGLDMQDGALIEPLAVGLHGVRLVGVRPGDRILVIGAGPVGLATAYWARRAGAGKIAITASSRRREALAREMGADEFLLPEEGQPLSTAVALALGGPADMVFECAGVPGMLDRAISCTKRLGTVVVLGICMQPETITAFPAVLNEVVLRFAFAADRREFEICLDAMSRGGIEPRSMISDSISLHDTPAVFERLRTEKGPCKVMINPWA